MDKELLKKYRLEEAQKRFQQICEYTMFANNMVTDSMITEEGEDENGGDMQQQPQDANMGGDPNGGQMPQGPQQPPQQSGPEGMPPAGGGGDMQPPVGDPTQDGGQQGVDPNANPQGGGEGEFDMDIEGDGNVDTMQPDDEVIDVDELTKAQETADVKIDGVNDKLTSMLSVMNKFIAAIDQNDKKIDDLRAEFEKRNPTEEERINIRSQASAPYSQTPMQYWDEKSKDSNYNVIYNNDVDPDKEEEEFVIKRGDIGRTDDRSLAKSLDYPTKLENFINF